MEDEVAAVKSLIAPIKAYCVATAADGSSMSSKYIRQMLYKIIGSQRKPLLGAGKPDLRAIYSHLGCGFCKGPAGSITTAGAIDPITLPCGHLVCRSCILGHLFIPYEGGPVQAICPTCDTRHPKAIIDSIRPSWVVANINGYLLRSEGGSGAADPASTIPPPIQAAQAALMTRFADYKGYDRLKSDAANAAIRDELNSLLRAQVPLSGMGGAIYKEGLECAVCFNMLGMALLADGSTPASPDPITLNCGHSFCRLCIPPVAAGSQICPGCRAPCHVTAIMPPPSSGIRSLVGDLNPRDGEFAIAAVGGGASAALSEDPTAVGGRRRYRRHRRSRNQKKSKRSSRRR